MFHKHIYLFNEITGQCHCHCGKHYCPHVWEEYSSLVDTLTKGKRGCVLKCKICGDLKNHYVID